MLRCSRWLFIFIIVVAVMQTWAPGSVQASSAALLKAGPLAEGARAQGFVTGSSYHSRQVLVRWQGEEFLDFDLRGAVVRRSRQKGTSTALVELPEDVSVRQALEIYSRRRGVEFVQPNYIYRIDFAPSDPLFEGQWHLPRLRADAAWDTSLGGPPVVVAILDSGVDLNHPDLVANLVPGYNLLDPESLPQDDNGHGTAVAGAVAAVIDNGIGVAGVAGRAAGIMPVKVLSSEGSGSSWDISRGIYWAVDNGAKIINLSLGMPWEVVEIPDLVVQDAIAHAQSQGVLVVAAAGNQDPYGPYDIDLVHFPANQAHVVAVGASDRDDNRAVFSQYGEALDLVAPGVSIYTTARGGDYAPMSGTSFAAPMVSGAAAWLWSLRPGLTGNQLETLLGRSARDLGPAGWDSEYGYGLLDVAAALSAELPVPGPEEAGDRPESSQPLDLNTWSFGSIATVGDRDWFSFTAPDDGRYFVEIEPPPSMDAVIEVSDAPEDYLNTIDFWGVGRADIGTLELDSGSLYYLKVADFNTRWSDESYRLRVTREITVDGYEPNDSREEAVLLAAEAEVYGSFYPDGDVDWFRLVSGSAGPLQVKVTPPQELPYPGIDPVVEVYDNQGQRLAIIDSGGPNASEEETVDLPAGGIYYLRLSEFRNGFSKEHYRLWASYSDPLGELHGQVRLQGRGPASGAEVVLTAGEQGGAEPGQPLITTTDATGNFIVQQLLPGAYTVEVAYEGFARAGRGVSVPPGGGEVYLTELSLLAGDVDGDGCITLGDLRDLGGVFGRGDGLPVAEVYDVNGDGRLDVADIALVARNKGGTLRH